jgi:uncharacterized protein
MTAIDGTQLHKGFVSGGREVMRNRQALDKINVFPVPDGDTGSNLSMTISSIFEKSVATESAGETMRSIADAGLEGAHGNSGMIFVQFFHGLSEAIGDAKALTIELFGKAVKRAVEKAYRAVGQPVEGTMLTVIRQWSESVVRLYNRSKSWVELLAASLPEAERSLSETQQTLEVMKENGVVDAGARGFVEFLRGFTRFLKHGDIENEDISAPVIEDRHIDLDENADLDFRYCCEALIKNATATESDFQAILKKHGDSAIVVGSGKVFRIHLHTNDPSSLFFELKNYGSLSRQKVDDMRRQYEAIYKKKYPIALVTDSSCDLPQEILDHYQIHLVPLNLIIGDAQYLDKLSISSDHFYTMLDDTKTYPTTSQPSAALFRQLYSFLLEHYESVIAIHLSSVLSGTFNVSFQEMKRIADEGNNKDRISVIDSKQLSGSLGLIVMRAAEAIAGGARRDEVEKSLETWIPKADNFVSVTSLKYMVRGGRVSPLKGLMAKILNLKPIVSVDDEGRSELYGKAFSRKANRKKIIAMVEKIHVQNPLKYYAVVHAHASADAEAFIDQLKEIIGFPPAYTMDISPVVGLNAGLGAVSVVTMQE